ncbi:MAG: cobalamin-dependent protein, partial [Pseudomonadales bacterium]
MKIFFIYPNFGGYAKIPVGMTLLMTILKNEGHKVELFDVSFIIEDHNFADEVMEKLGSKETDTTHLYDYHTFEEIDDLLVSKLKNFSPDLVAANIVEDNYRYCHRLLKLIKTIDPEMPTIVGGSTPSIAANTVIENPYIDYLIKGEAEGPMSEFCSLMEKNEDVTKTASLWYRKNGEVHHNELAPLTDMDELPM